jgi:hypothetical protein
MRERKMTKEDEIMEFLHQRVFQPVLQSETATKDLKSGVNLTIARMSQRDAKGMLQYFWSAVIGTERSTAFAKKMRAQKFIRFEEVIDEFRERFSNEWIRKK